MCKNVGNETNTPAQLIELLKLRGITIDNDEHALRFLESISYASLIPPYASIFYDSNTADTKVFYPGTNFNEICELYNFDRKIRSLFFEYILIVEHKLKTLVSEYFAETYGALEYWNPANFTSEPKKKKAKDDATLYISATQMLDELKVTISEKKKKREDVNETSNINVMRIPIWDTINMITLGAFRNFYHYLKTRDRQNICYKLFVRTNDMETCLYVLNHFRNACAHDEPIYNYCFKRKIHFGTSDNKQEYTGVYAAVKVLKLLLSPEHFLEFYSKLNEYMDNFFPSLFTLPSEKILTIMGFTKGQHDILSEMGPYKGNDSLSDKDFYDVISKYIMPILYGETVEIIPADEIPQKERASLMAINNDYVYFSQSLHSEYKLRAKINHSIENDIFETAKLHMTILMSNIQIVWNANKACILSPLERQKLFSLNIEIAYQLSICILLCNTTREQYHQHVMKTEYCIRVLESSTVPEKVTKIESLKDTLLTQKAQYKYILDLEKKQQETLYGILSCFDEWSQKTYEGKHMPFGVIVNKTLIGLETSFSYHDFLQKNYSATISDGSFSCVEISADGRFVKHIKNAFPEEELFSIPYLYQGFASECIDGKIGIILTGEGDILIISDEKIAFSKHSGRWKYNLHFKAINYIKEFLSPVVNKQELAECIMQTLIDLSYSHGGACIAIAKDNPPNPNMLRLAYSVLLNESDRKQVELQCTIPDEEKAVDQFRISVLDHFTQKSKMFNELNTNLRRELLEMDGALLMGCDGKIYAVAAIVKLNGSSNESGARTTAALQLSEYGLAIKVSQDGYMKFFSNREEILTI